MLCIYKNFFFKTHFYMLFLFDFSVYYFFNIVYVQSICISFKGRIVKEGTYFIPEVNSCRFCECIDNEENGCIDGPCIFPPPKVSRP